MGAEVARDISAFRVFRTQLREAFSEYRAGPVSLDVFLTWGTTRFSSVVVRHDPRRAGVSNYTLRMLIEHALSLVTGFSTVPLRLASLVGVGTLVFGIGVFLYVLGRYLIEGGSVPGFPFLASVMSIFAGAQLFALGILGEYLARLHSRLLGRPSYAIREERS
jgi:undecaprenyl-phosphate 4-deoxy-4-formamido-L-arabinose transferase